VKTFTFVRHQSKSHNIHWTCGPLDLTNEHKAFFRTVKHLTTD